MGFKDADLAAIATFDTSKNIYLTVVGKGKEQHLEAMERNFLGRLWMKLGISDSSIDKVAAYVNGLEFDKDGIQALRERAKDPELGQKFSQFEQKLIKHIQNTTEGPPSLDVVGKAAIRMVLLLNEKEYLNMKVEIEEWIGILDKKISKLIGSKDSKASSQLNTLQKERTELQEQLIFFNLAARNAAVSSVSIPIITETNKPPISQQPQEIKRGEESKKEATKEVPPERASGILSTSLKVEEEKRDSLVEESAKTSSITNVFSGQTSILSASEAERASEVEDDGLLPEEYEYEFDGEIEEDDIQLVEDIDPDYDPNYTITTYRDGQVIEGRDLLARSKFDPVKSGKHSEVKEICKLLLSEKLEREGKEMGKAIDNGDCFYDSVAQQLTNVLGIDIAMKDVRKSVKTEVDRLNKVDPDGSKGINYPLIALRKEVDEDVAKNEQPENILRVDQKIYSITAYNELVSECEYGADERNGAPLWGRTNIEGKIIAEVYGVTIKEHGMGVVQEAFSEKAYSKQDILADDETAYFSKATRNLSGDIYVQLTRFVKTGDEATVEPSEPSEKTIEIAIYPGHFVPVWEIK